MIQMDAEFPKRKDLRLRGYDYSSKGAYFVTICVKNRKPILSNIINSVGVGAHDDPFCKGDFPSVVGALDDPFCKGDFPSVVGAHDDPRISLTEIGRIVRKYLLSSEKIPGVKVDRYVIMPDHIHAIIFLDPNAYSQRKDGSSWAPTPTNEMLPHIVSTFKRLCNKEIGENIFQRGYIEHIIRDRDDYDTRKRYIHYNPARWQHDKTHTEIP